MTRSHTYDFLVLAAGRGTRFAREHGGEKLLVRVGGLSLPQRAVLFAAANGARRCHVTVSSDGNQVLDDVLEAGEQAGLDVVTARQDPAVYGTGAALMPWRERIHDPVVVLFGDNFYHGTVPHFPEPAAVHFTFKEIASPNTENLRFAAVQGDTIIEKPHHELSGRFFAGLVRFPSAFLSAATFTPGRRGEYEITDLVNAHPVRRAVPLEASGLLWDDVNEPSDVARVELLAAHCGPVLRGRAR